VAELPRNDPERSDSSGVPSGSASSGSYSRSRTFAELLIDCEEEWALRAALVGILLEMERK
jgi:hypothetical protein